ncbi:hypothetical protein M514_04669, partial [Trichuris suis]
RIRTTNKRSNSDDGDKSNRKKWPTNKRLIQSLEDVNAKNYPDDKTRSIYGVEERALLDELCHPCLYDRAEQHLVWKRVQITPMSGIHPKRPEEISLSNDDKGKSKGVDTFPGAALRSDKTLNSAFKHSFETCTYLLLK